MAGNTIVINNDVLVVGILSAFQFHDIQCNFQSVIKDIFKFRVRVTFYNGTSGCCPEW
jgi:hypothetical protein